jgi:TolA-binding protein
MSDYRLSFMNGCGVGPIGLVYLLFSFSFFLVHPSQTNGQITSQQKATALVEEQDYAFAYGLYQDGLYQLAEEQLNKFLQKYPASLKKMDVMFLRGECFFSLQRFEDARLIFEEFLNTYPRGRLSDDAHFRLGELNLRLKQAQVAIQHFKTILDQFGLSELAGESAFWIGEGYLQLDDDVNALKYYSFAYEGYVENRLRDYAAYSCGWVYQKKGNYPAAIEWYRKVINEFPSGELSSSARIRMAECAMKMGEYRQAIQFLADAITKGISKDEMGEVMFLTGESYYQLKEYRKAEEYYRKVLTESPGHKRVREAHYGLGWVFLHEKDYGSAVEEFSHVTGSDELAQAALYRKAVVQQLSGNSQDALATFLQVPSLDATGEYADNALFDAGLLLFDQKKIGQARELFDRVTAEHPQSDILADAYRMLGECLIGEERYDDARKAFEKSLVSPAASFTSRVNASFRLGWTLFKLKKYQEASAIFLDFIGTYPEHPLAIEARFWLAESQYRQGNFQSARANYEFVGKLPSHEKKEDALYGVAWCFYKLNDYAGASTAFERLLAAFPTTRFAFDAVVRLADCAFFLKDYKKAINNYRQVIRKYPGHPSLDYVHYQLAQASYRAGDQAEAIANFAKVAESFPQSDLADDAQYTIGWIWFQSKEYATAIKEFEKVVRSYPAGDMAARATYSIGDAYYNLKQYQRAEQAYRDVLMKYPNSPAVADAVSGIQYSLTARGKSQEALRVIDDFINQNPDTPIGQSLYLRKGDLLVAQKEYEKAIEEYQSFIQKYPRSPVVAVAYHSIGRVLQELGKLGQAAQSYVRAASVEGAAAGVVAQALYDAGVLYLQAKTYDKALDVLERLEKEHSSSDLRPEASYLKGQVFLENGATIEAINQFEFVRKHFDNTTAGAKSALALARISLAKGAFERAHLLCEQVATTRTDEIGAEAQYLRGALYLEEKDWNNAAIAFLRVRYVFPNYTPWLAKSLLGLGSAYEYMKDLHRAKEAYQQVINLNRDGEELVEAQRRLKNLERM